MRDHLEIDAARIHILQTSRAKISKLRLLFGNESPTRAPSLAGSVSPHRLSEPIGQEMFFDRNCSHANSSSSLYLSMAEASTATTIPHLPALLHLSMAEASAATTIPRLPALLQ